MKFNLLNFTNRENTSIDSVRFIAAIAVILIHSNLHIVGGMTETTVLFLMPFARLAVPFFFLASGYFMYTEHLKKAMSRHLNATLKLASIFILSSILYFFFYSFISGSFTDTFNLLSAQSIFNMVLFNRPVYNTVLWFILALLSVNVLFYIKCKLRISDSVFFAISVLLFIVGLLWGGNYSSVLHSEHVGPLVYRSFIGMGLIFTTTGYLIKKHALLLTSISVPKLARYSIVALVLYLIEFYAISRDNPNPADVYIMMPVISCLGFIWLIKYPYLLRRTVLPKLGVSISLYIYIIHPLLIDSLGWIYLKSGINVLHPRPAILRFIVVSLSSVLISYIYFWFKPHIKSFIRDKSKKNNALRILVE